MITWATPWAFALLILVALLPWQPRWTGVLRLIVPGLDVHEAGWTVRRAVAWLPLALRMVGLALCVVAMARPQLTNKRTVVESEGLDIILAVDTSGSMRAQDMTSGVQAVDRLSVAKAVMARFVEERPYDRIGVVVFGAEAFTHVPLTLDHDTLTSVLDQVQIGVAGEGATAIGSAIAVSSKRLADLKAPSKLVILLTDGRSNAGRFEPKQAAELAKALGIKVYTIGVGGGNPRGGGLFARMNQDGVDEESLKEVAATTGAAYFRATDTRALQSVYDKINKLEPSPAEVEQIEDHEELYRRFLVPGVVLLFLQSLLSTTWLRRWP